MLPSPVWRGILLSKQQNGWRIPFLKSQIILEKDHEAHEKRFDYSETRLPANAPGKTTPNLVLLPKGPGIDRRRSLRNPARRTFALGDQHQKP